MEKANDLACEMVPGGFLATPWLVGAMTSGEFVTAGWGFAATVLHQIRANTRLLLPILWLLCLAGSPAWTDGGFFGKGVTTGRDPVSSPGQKALILRDGADYEILVLQTTYRGPASEFAWVIPVPGCPRRDDVFLADPSAVDALAAHTGPLFEDEIGDPVDGRRHADGWGVEAPSSSPGALSPAKVIVHARMALGDYGVVILSAAAQSVLPEWLSRNGYAIPPEAGRVIDDYVARRWCFVALKVRPEARRASAILSDLQPVGIRFPTKTLIYPLAISKVGAPPVTTMLLVVVDGGTVRCASLPTLALPDGTRGAMGEAYSTLVRKAIQAHGGEALVCEGRQPLSMVYGMKPEIPRGVRKRADGRSPAPAAGGATRPALPGEELPWDDLTATRFWGEVPREAMADLTFSPDAAAPSRLRCDRHAQMRAPFRAYLLRWGLLLITPFLGLAALWPRRRLDVGRPAIRAVAWMASPATAVLVLRVAGAHAFDPWAGGLDRAPWEHSPAAGLAAIGAATGEAHLSYWLIGILLLLCGAMHRRLPAATAARGVPWAALLLIVALGALAVLAAKVGWRHEALVWPPQPTTVALLALLCWPPALLLAAAVPTRPNPEGAAIGCCAGVLLLLVTYPQTSEMQQRLIDQVWPQRLTANRDLETGLATIEGALARFRQATGAYPERLADLTAVRAPSGGLDTSGNQVAIGGDAAMPVIPALPVDPLTGRRDTWVYDPRSPTPVTSGAFTVSVEVVTW